jgi:hypothetical protein
MISLFCARLRHLKTPELYRLRGRADDAPQHARGAVRELIKRD